MAVKIGSARIDENGRAHGGKAGDQTGKEVSTQNWYLNSKGWRVYRAKNPAVAEKIAQCMERACANSAIGYDQYQRNTLYKEAEKFGFDTAKVTTPVETDCSALVRVCCAFAGIVGLPEGFRTGNMPTNLSKTGAFTELTGSKYQEQSTYLGRGDILVTKTSGHTVVVLSNGSKYEGTVQPKEYAIGDRILKYGCEGSDVKILQEALLKLGYDLGKWGCDGDFGDCTELALEEFQKDARVEVDGECGPQTLAALREALSALEEQKPTGKTVLISGGNCYIRTAPNTTGKIVGVAHNGDKLPYGGEISDGGWPMIEHEGRNAWVSGKYGRLIDE